MIFFFFFSSRRRHTRFDCDWSSDVCSSDLATKIQTPAKSRTTIHALVGQSRATRTGSLRALEIRCTTVGLERGSRMKREFHVRFYEGPGAKFPRATRLLIGFEREDDAK